MQLSAQSIHQRCDPNWWFLQWPGPYVEPLGEPPAPRAMIEPYSPTRTVIHGRSAGLSAATYDCRLGQDLVLGVNPGITIARALATMHQGLSPAQMFSVLQHVTELALKIPMTALSNTLEDFAIPANVCGYVVDKSSHARLFVSAFNTFLDPGWAGNLTLELVNLGDNELVLHKGDPICQIAFHFLDRVTDRPYTGKYMDQPKRPVAAIHESAE